TLPDGTCAGGSVRCGEPHQAEVRARDAGSGSAVNNFEIGRFPSSQRSIQSCPAGQLHNSKEVGRTKTKDLSSYFLERGIVRFQNSPTPTLAAEHAPGSCCNPHTKPSLVWSTHR